MYRESDESIALDWLDMRYRTILVITLLVIATAGCGGSDEDVQDEIDALNEQIAGLEAELVETSTGPASHDITGTFTVEEGSMTAKTGDPCFTEGGYDDIGAGTQVVVRDGTDGSTLATGRLGGGEWALTVLGTNSDLRYCEFSILVKDVPTGPAFYEIEVGRRGSLTYSSEELDEIGWDIAFTLT